MNNKTIEILIYLLGYLKENNFDDESLSEFSENLVLNGFSENDVAEALSLLMEKLNFVPMKQSEVVPQRLTSTRVLSDFERINITADVFGYVTRLRYLNIINGSQMEKVLDYCMLAESHRIKEQEINELVAEVIFDDHMNDIGRDN